MYLKLIIAKKQLSSILRFLSNRSKECSNIIINVVVDISGPHVVQMIIVFNDFGLDATRKNSEQLREVALCNKIVIATSKQQHADL